MRHILATFLAVFASSGCVLGSEDDADATQHEQVDDVQGDESAEQTSPPPSYEEGDSDGDWSSNPCNGQTGVTYFIDGRELFVPAACNPHYIEKGTPPELTGDLEDLT
jgi:hypothetical protein